MSKGKNPRKRKDPKQEIEPQTEVKAELVPQAREPRPLPSAVPERHPPALVDFVQTLRRAVGAMLDFADAAAEAIRNRIEGRA